MHLSSISIEWGSVTIYVYHIIISRFKRNLWESNTCQTTHNLSFEDRRRHFLEDRRRYQSYQKNTLSYQKNTRFKTKLTISTKVLQLLTLARYRYFYLQTRGLSLVLPTTWTSASVVAANQTNAFTCHWTNVLLFFTTILVGSRRDSTLIEYCY